MKILILGSCIALLILSGCAQQSEMAEEDITLDTETTVSEEAESDSVVETKKANSFELYGLNFRLPTGWTGEATATGSAVIYVPDDKYKVTLPVRVVKSPGHGLADLELIYEGKAHAVYRNPCGGGVMCYTVNKFQDAIFDVYFDKLQSTEQPPANLDGIWNPSTKISNEDLDQIMRNL